MRRYALLTIEVSQTDAGGYSIEVTDVGKRVWCERVQPSDITLVGEDAAIRSRLHRVVKRAIDDLF